MTVHVRLTRQLYEQVRVDLLRPHPFATERIGFLFARLGNINSTTPLVLLTGYSPLADDRYINDLSAGARIDSQAIRSAMQQVLNRKEGVFHVHMHDWPGKPRFSRMDRTELPRLIPSFQAAGPSFPHGLFLLSKDNFTAAVWQPGKTQPAEADRITIVGHPLQVFERE
jgi:hypothetical protein